MNGYVCFYKGKRLEVEANSSYEAQKKAAELFKAKKSYDVTVTLAEKNGQQVTHDPGILNQSFQNGRMRAEREIAGKISERFVNSQSVYKDGVYEITEGSGGMCVFRGNTLVGNCGDINEGKKLISEDKRKH